MFTGDALFIGGCGRTDFQGGDAGALYDCITQRLLTLPDDTLVYPGHDYQQRWVSNIAQERTTNPRLAGKTREQFIEIMNNLNLPKPKLIDEAKPVLMYCRTGGRASLAAVSMKALGYTNVVSMAGGYEAWQKAS